jgi:phospholipase/carboxylesterase
MYKIIIIALLTMSNIQLFSQDTTTLHYIVKEPKIKSTNTPILILLHGKNSDEEDLFSMANSLPGNYRIVSARAPFVFGQNSYAWYEVDFSTGKPVFDFQQEEKSRQDIIQFIEYLKRKYASDSSEIYLCGFSQGGIMSYNIALTRPDLIQGAAIMSGRLIEEIKPLIVAKEKLQHLKIFISHGTNDNVLQIDYARKANAYLKTLNLNPIYKEYPEGHSINLDMLNDLSNWLK